ncbi:MAG: nucleotidyltransferase family protein [Cyclobacteriaceae bacterium]
MNRTDLAILILAAGESSRLGRAKQLINYKGTTLLGYTIDCAKTVSDKVTVVLGGNEETIVGQVDFSHIDHVSNKKWKEGIGSSISCGIDAIVSRHPNIDSIMVLLSDQPKISAELLKKLYISYKNDASLIIACKYGGSYGVPAIFEKSLFNDLSMLKEDKGAKSIITTHSNQTIFTDFEEGQIDIDTPNDLEKLK